jgi:hypothetical protein
MDRETTVSAISHQARLFRATLQRQFLYRDPKESVSERGGGCRGTRRRTPKMASQSIAIAQGVAQNVFDGEASTVQGLSYNAPQINVGRAM